MFSISSFAKSQRVFSSAARNFNPCTLSVARFLFISTIAKAQTVNRTLATMTDPSKYLFNHSMLRVKDPKASIKFYEFLGMKTIDQIDFPENKFSLYFLAYDDKHSATPGAHRSDRQGVLELTHNHGSENDSSFKIANGNSEPGKGFGHVCVAVDNIQAACTRLENEGYKFQKKLSDGRMRHIAFALDPDGYWVEIIGQNDSEKTKDVKETDTGSYRFVCFFASIDCRILPDSNVDTLYRTTR